MFTAISLCWCWAFVWKGRGWRGLQLRNVELNYILCRYTMEGNVCSQVVVSGKIKSDWIWEQTQKVELSGFADRLDVRVGEVEALSCLQRNYMSEQTSQNPLFLCHIQIQLFLFTSMEKWNKTLLSWTSHSWALLPLPFLTLCLSFSASCPCVVDNPPSPHLLVLWETSESKTPLYEQP